MSCVDEFREWLHRVRFAREVCILIPMEACMGLPLVTAQGTEFLIPFFRAASFKSVDTLTPPFAYIRVSYPSATILTYSNLRSLPGWKQTDWHSTIEKRESLEQMTKLAEYYKVISDQTQEQYCMKKMDALLLRCLENDNKPSPLVAWYQKLLAEAEKYREGETGNEEC